MQDSTTDTLSAKTCFEAEFGKTAKYLILEYFRLLYSWKIWRGINLAVWWIDQATTKLKPANISHSFAHVKANAHHKANWWVHVVFGPSMSHVARSNLQLVFGFLSVQDNLRDSLTDD